MTESKTSYGVKFAIVNPMVLNIDWSRFVICPMIQTAVKLLQEVTSRCMDALLSALMNWCKFSKIGGKCDFCDQICAVCKLNQYHIPTKNIL